MALSNFKNNIAEIYALDQARRETLAAILAPVLDGQKRLNMSTDATDTEKLAHLVNNETFKILVIGEFNVGKSTFINALIGEDALPTKAIPATAIINILKYGQEKKARLHYRDKDKRPISIPIEKLSEYVLIKNTGGEDSAQTEIRNAIFSHAEVWWPLDLLKNNKVEIIDSPGLNENKVREDITMDYLKRVDAVLFLMSAVRFGPAQSEMDSIAALKSAEHKDIFFLVNQWDMLRSRDKDDVKEKALNVLPKLTERKNGIYFVSAMDALEGRVDNNPELEQKSGFKVFEDALHTFLAEEKGRIKMLRSGRELTRIIRNNLTITIPQKIALLKMPLKEVETRYVETMKKIEELGDEKKEMLDFVTRQRYNIVNYSEVKVKEFFNDVETKIENWAWEYDLQTKFSLNIKSQVEASIHNLGEHLKTRLEEEFKAWADYDLTPFLEDRMDSMRKDLDRQAERFEERLQDARFALSGIDFDQENIADDFGPSSPLERLLAAAGGWFIGGIGAGAIGAVFGWKEMLKGLIPNIGAIIIAVIAGIPLLPVMLIVSALYGVYAFSKIDDKIKAQVIGKFKEGLRASKKEHAEKIANNIDNQLYQLQEALRAGMENQIDSLKELADSAQTDRQKEQGDLDKKLTEIEGFKATLEKKEKDLDAFIEQILAK